MKTMNLSARPNTKNNEQKNMIFVFSLTKVYNPLLLLTSIQTSSVKVRHQSLAIFFPNHLLFCMLSEILIKHISYQSRSTVKPCKCKLIFNKLKIYEFWYCVLRVSILHQLTRPPYKKSCKKIFDKVTFLYCF